MLKPKIGVIVVAMPGFNLGEEDCKKYLTELVRALKKYKIEIIEYNYPITSIIEAERVAKILDRNHVDLYIVLIGTFVPDYLVMPIATNVNTPIIIWAHDKNIFNLSLVGAQNVTPVLWEAGINFRFVSANFNDPVALKEILIFARACALRKKLKKTKIGYWGGHPSIMSELVVDEVATRMKIGPMLINFGNDDIIVNRDLIPEVDAKKEWENIKSCAGHVRSTEENGLINARTLLYIKGKVKEYSLDAVSINCWPYLKGQVCIPIARLNDLGIPAACEGDLNSAILMLMLTQLSGKVVSFGDQIKVIKNSKTNSLIFSHCGAGAFSLAASWDQIVIHEDFETRKGIGVYFPETRPGEVTICNLTGLGDSYRMFITKGKVIHTEMIYEGNPMNVQFDFDINEMLKNIAYGGFGHHWILAYGDYVGEMKEFCKLAGIRYQVML